MKRIYVIHENDAWLVPLREAFRHYDLPFTEWFLNEGTVPFDDVPPEGVFYNRMSASSHTRGHRYGPELAACVLTWLRRHGRRIVNGPTALDLEVSKMRQYSGLAAHGIRVPKTVAAVGRQQIIEAADAFGYPLILKPNRGGKGLGVRLFRSSEELRGAVNADDFDAGIDGVMLVQEIIEGPEPVIIRNEFVGGRFHYAVKVDTGGGFELCPADACEIGEAACPVGEEPDQVVSAPRFEVMDGFEHPVHAKLEAFLAAQDIEVAGCEMIIDHSGLEWVYDVNTNTNYNSTAEVAAGYAGTDRAGMMGLAKFLGGLLQ
ncbi:MAG: hypothetical protein ACI9OJ_001873 [Myxococcota bacterium]|jgi:hypothetical protein